MIAPLPTRQPGEARLTVLLQETVAAFGVEWTVTAEVTLFDDWEHVQVTEAFGELWGRVRWYAGARFFEVIGRVEEERVREQLAAIARNKMKRGIQ